MAPKTLFVVLGVALAICIIFFFQVNDLMVRVVVTTENRTKECLDTVPKIPSPKSVHKGVKGIHNDSHNQQNWIRLSTTAGIPRMTTPKEYLAARNPLPTTRPVQKPKALPRILCWVMCDPSDLDKRVKHVKMTWAKHCDITLYMSSERNDTFPTIGMDVPSGRNHINIKTRKAWMYVHDHYLDKADYFVKCDPDTFLVVPNMKLYLATRNPDESELFGHRFYLGGKKDGLMYTSGGPGLVLSREALKRMVEKAFTRPGMHCMPDGEGEDWMVARCLKLVGFKLVDTRDSQGRETFMVFTPTDYVNGRFPDWYLSYDMDGAMWGYNRECCSDRPIGFHYISSDLMHVLYYLFYKVKQIGESQGNSTTGVRFYNDAGENRNSS